MTNNDLNQIRGVVKEELAPVTKKLDAVWDQTAKLTEDLAEVQDTLDSHTKTLNAHTVFLRRIEGNAENNSDNLKKLDKRATKVEDQLGIVPPPELTLPS